ncbi:MAG TPA: outer membrane beta-barrel protein [Bryobacteraceae bacterium]|nr:outer membrane beta-barrel protein [Bryobacteraceae bacterium]
MRRLFWLLLSALPALAQPFSAGIKAGIPLTDMLNANSVFGYNAPPQRYIIGGEAEVRLPFSLGVEFDALYRHVEYSYVAESPALNASGGNWEFPLVLKYRFHFPVARPYVEAGVAWDTITGLKEAVNHNTTTGVVIGAGVDIHAIVLHISPEVRFTRWNTQQVSTVQSTIDVLHTNLNQAEFLVGFTF